MPLIPFDPFRLLDRWKKVLDQFWKTDFPNVFPEEIGGPLNLEVRETDKEVVVYCQASGLNGILEIRWPKAN